MKKHFLRILLVLLAACLGVGVMAACGEPADPGTDAKYKLTYDLNGGKGTVPTGGEYAQGAKITLNNGDGLTKDDYTFDGWLDGTTRYAGGAEYTMPDHAVTLKANWKEAAVAADPIEGVWTFTELTDVEVAENVPLTALKITVDLVEGKSFAGYAVVDMKVSERGTEFHQVAAVKLTEADGVYSGAQGDFTLSVKFTADNKLDATLPDEINLTTATKAALPGALAISGTYYVADADWEIDFTAKTLKVEDEPEDATFTSVADYVLLEPAAGEEEAIYVIYQEGETYKVYLGEGGVELTTQKPTPAPTTYTVTFDGGEHGTTSAASVEEKNADEKVDLPAATAVTANKGYEFEGWYKKDNTKVDGTQYTVAAADAEGTTVTLTAHYNYIQYTVEFSKGTVEGDVTLPSSHADVSLEEGHTTITLTTLNNVTGYVFDGWKVGDSNLITGNSYTITENDLPDNAEAHKITVTAQWHADTQILVTYELDETGKAADAVVPSAEPATKGGSLTLPAAPAAAKGYEFDAWYVKSGDNSTKAAEAGQPYTVGQEAVTLIGKYKEITYTVEYKSGVDGNTGVEKLPADGTISLSSALTLPDDPTRTGYAFAGWNGTGVQGSPKKGESITLTDAIIDGAADKTITLTAQWTKQYTLKFYAEKDQYTTPVEGGTITVLEGQTISEAEGFSALKATKEGMVLEGWYYMKGDVETAFDASKTPEELITEGTELTVYAKWAYAIIGNPDNSAGFPGLDAKSAINPYKGKIEQGYRYTFTGTQTSAAKNNWETIATYIYSGEAPVGYFRVDNWVKEAAPDRGDGTVAMTTKENWVIAKYNITGYETYTAAQNGTFEIDIDWTNETLIRLSMRLTATAGKATGYFEELYTIRASQDHELAATYNLIFGSELSYVKILTYEKSETALAPVDASEGTTATVGSEALNLGYTGYFPEWIGRSFKSGEAVTLTGTVKTAGEHGWQVPIAYLMSNRTNSSVFRLDGWFDGIIENGENVTVVSQPGITNADTNYNTDGGKAGANDDTQFLGALKEGDVTFTLTYDWKDASKIVITAKFEKGDVTRTTTFTVTPKAGFADQYWIGLGGDSLDLQITNIATDDTPVTYAVTYELGDHAKAGEKAPTQEPVVKGTQIDLPKTNPEAATGYEFDGWYVGEDKIETETYEVTKAVTITAHWKPIEYTLTFNTNKPEDAGVDKNIEGTANDITVTLVEATKSLPELSLEGYTFNGWKLNNEGEATKSFTLTTDLIEKLQGGSKQFSFTADWTKNTPDDVTITFTADEKDAGSPMPKDTQHAPGEYTIPEEEPTRKGYTFKGWKVTADNDEKLYKHGGENQTYTVKEKTPVTFEAQWDPITYTLNFYKEKGQEEEADYTVTVTGRDAVDGQLPAFPTKDFYKCIGWYLADDETEVDAAYAPYGQSETELKVYAKWGAPDAKAEGSESISDLTVATPENGTALWQQTIGYGQTIKVTGTPAFTAGDALGVGDGVMPIIAPLQGGLVLSQFIQFRLDSFNYNDYSKDGALARVDMGNNLTYYDGAVTLTKVEGTASDWFNNLANAMKVAESYTITVDYSHANEINITIAFTTQSSFIPTGEGGGTAAAWTHSMTYHLLPIDPSVKLADAYTLGLGGYKCNLTNVNVQTTGTATEAPAAAVEHIHDFTGGACSCGATIENEQKDVTLGSWGSSLDASSTTLYKGQTISLEATYNDQVGKDTFHGVVIQIRSLGTGLQGYFLRPAADYAFSNDFLWNADTNVKVEGTPLAASDKVNATVKITATYEGTTVTIKYETWKSGTDTSATADSTITFTISNMAQGAYTIAFGLDSAEAPSAKLNTQKVNPAPVG